MVFGPSKKEFEAIEAENAYLKQWLEHAQASDAVTISYEIAQLKAEKGRLDALVRQALHDLEVARLDIVETREMALLQEAGIYEYRHPLEDAVTYQGALKELKDRIKATVSSGEAVAANTDWRVNDSLREGAKMVKDFSKLMLRAYNAEADNTVKTLKPYALESAKQRLTKVRDTIARLGQTMAIQVTEGYHQLRLYELELTADYLVKKGEERERIREEKARAREEEKALREFEAEKKRLEKERSHFQSAIESLLAKGDTEGAAELQDKLAQVDSAIAGVEEREANVRAGYVYVISNIGAFGERMVKIGLTRRLDPMDRVRELGDASVPFQFDVHALIFSEDAVSLETSLHKAFEERKVNRVNSRREFFYATPHEVREVLASMETEVLLEFHEQPEAFEWRASGGADRSKSLTPSILETRVDAPDNPRMPALPGLPEPLVASDVNASTPEPEDSNPTRAALPVSERPSATTTATQEVSPEPVLSQETTSPFANWYPDPSDQSRLRYWDGQQWTDHTAD